MRSAWWDRAETPETAFEARLVPVSPREPRTPGQTQQTATAGVPDGSPTGAQTDAPAPPEAAAGQDAAPSGPAGFRKKDNRPTAESAAESEAPAERAAPVFPTSRGEATPAAPASAGPHPSAQGQTETRASAAPASEAARRAEEAAPPEGAATRTPVARDIRLELASGDRRVEVRLAEVGGEVHVAVRTPDQRLSGALRDNLPELAARLEGSGYRAEAPHQASADSRRDAPQPGNSQDGNSRPQPDGRQREGDAQPRQPKNFAAEDTRKQKGKEFAWFMSSLR